MATHSSPLGWKIPRTEEPGGLQPVGLQSQTWLSDFTFTFHFGALEKEIETHSSVLAWRIPGMVKPGGLPSMGSHRHDLVVAAAATATCYTLDLQNVSILHLKFVPPTPDWLFWSHHAACSDHSFWTRDQTHTLCSGIMESTTGLPGNSLKFVPFDQHLPVPECP